MKEKITYSYGHLDGEVGQIHEIERENFSMGSRWSKESFRSVVEKYDMWVARIGDRPVGYLVGWKQGRYGCYIGTVAVRTSYHGRGIGTKLISMAEDFYRQKGQRYINLAVNSVNPAQVLYFRLGYRISRFSKKNSQLNMRKPLV